MDNNQVEQLSRVYLSLGSNLGYRHKHLMEGVRLMTRLGKLGAVSSLYETEPWGYTDPHAYLNMVIELFTSLDPSQLHVHICEAEKKRGRVVKTTDSTYIARELDIDILFFSDLVFSTASLTVPHPRLELRNFVLVPMAEINADFVHPISGKSMATLLNESRDESRITRFKGGI